MRVGEELTLWRLFHDTIHTVNLGDYSASQVDAWSPSERDQQQWTERMQMISPFVVELDGEIIGYSDVQADGLVDHMFVHKDWQRRGVATCLMGEIVKRAAALNLKILSAHVSITARPFFEAHGFLVEQKQTVTQGDGVTLTNFLMRRALSAGDE
ncbi:MAG: GNAT family N-acetyltransferase [Pseudomonadales bacterium]|nr:GNAT family N-acetyltransferase [Pseudomonadales bacterium]